MNIFLLVILNWLLFPDLITCASTNAIETTGFSEPNLSDFISNPYFKALIDGPNPTFKNFLRDNYYHLTDQTHDQETLLNEAFRDFLRASALIQTDIEEFLKSNLIDQFLLLKDFKLVDPDLPLTSVLNEFTLKLFVRSLNQFINIFERNERFMIVMKSLIGKLRKHFLAWDENVQRDLDLIENSSKKLLKSSLDLFKAGGAEVDLRGLISYLANQILSISLEVINQQDESFRLIEFASPIQMVKTAGDLLESQADQLDFSDERSWNRDFINTLSKFHASLLELTETTIPGLKYHWRGLPDEQPFTQSGTLIERDTFCENFDTSEAYIIDYNERNCVYKVENIFDESWFGNFSAYKTFTSNAEFHQELDAIKRIDSPFFAKYMADTFDYDSLRYGIVFEFIEGSKSKDYAVYADLPKLKSISAQLFLALEYLHSVGFVHADVKPENVLIDIQGRLKLIDFGFAFRPPSSRRQMGTPTTMAPELAGLVAGAVHEAIDWWAYGSTVAIWFGKSIHFRRLETCAAVIGDTFVPMRYNWSDSIFTAGVVPPRFPPELRAFLAIFFQPDPEARRINTPRQLLKIRQDPFFSGIIWEDYI